MRRFHLSREVLRALLPANRDAINLQLDEERAAMTLAATVGPSWDAVEFGTLINDRTRDFERNWMLGRSTPPQMTATAAAYRSILADVIEGRLRL